MKRLRRRGSEKVQKEQYYKEDCCVKSKKEADEADREGMLSSHYMPCV